MFQVSGRQVIFEISQTKNLAVMVDESTDISGQTQLVVVFRYIKLSGEVVERFWVIYVQKQ